MTLMNRVPSDPGSVAIMLCLFIFPAFFSCSSPPNVQEASLIPNPNERVPLAGVLNIKTDKPVKVSLLISDGTNETSVTPDESYQARQSVPVLGLHPDTDYTVTATLEGENGEQVILEPMSLKTPPLPDDFPVLELTQTAQGNLEPGVTMFSVFRWISPFDDDPEWGYLIAVDEQGEVVWYLKEKGFVDEGRRMYNGNLFYSTENKGSNTYEIDMLGNVINEWFAAGVSDQEAGENVFPVNTDTFHHEIRQMKSGNFIGLGLEVRRDEDYPLEYPPGTKRGPANLACDVIIEFAPDGSTLREYSLADLMDYERLGEGSLMQGFYSRLYEDVFDSTSLPYDVTHANALHYIEEEDAVIVSSNHWCALFKIDMKTGEIKWILGDPEGWSEELSAKLLTPKGDLTWPCHQHGVELTAKGDILIYDNGGGRYIPPQTPMNPDERFSRAVEYRVDEENMTVEEIWNYGPGQERFVSPFISDADELPQTGNILITDGGRFMDSDGNPVPEFGGHQWARILEVTGDQEPKKLWELTIKDPEVRYSVYRAQRLKSLYPKKDKPTG